MAWSTTRETLIRRFCPAVAEDTTNWTDIELQARWDDAFYWLKSRLCPPFSTTAIDALNHADTHAPGSDRIIARIAAHHIYTDLSSGDDQTEFEARQRLIDDWLEQIEAGSMNLFDSAGNILERESLVYHNHTDVEPEFTRSRYDKNSGTLIDSKTGSLDLHA